MGLSLDCLFHISLFGQQNHTVLITVNNPLKAGSIIYLPNFDFFFFRLILAVLGPFHFHANSGDLVNFCIVCWDFYWHFIDSVDELEKIDILACWSWRGICLCLFRSLISLDCVFHCIFQFSACWLFASSVQVIIKYFIFFCAIVKVCVSHLVVSDSLWPHGL